MHWVTSLGPRHKANFSADHFQYHTRGSDICAGWGLGMRLLDYLHFTSKYDFPKSNGTIPTFHNNSQLRGEVMQYYLTITTPCPVFDFLRIYMSLEQWYPIAFSWRMTAHSSTYYWNLLLGMKRTLIVLLSQSVANHAVSPHTCRQESPTCMVIITLVPGIF